MKAAYKAFKRFITRKNAAGEEIPYLIRWRIPLLFGASIFIHKFLDGDDEDPHDHPWPFITIPLWGSYTEHIYFPEKIHIKVMRFGKIAYRQATHVHRVELNEGRPCWTLIIQLPKVRTWGFHTEHGFVNWIDYDFYRRATSETQKKWRVTKIMKNYQPIRFRFDANED